MSGLDVTTKERSMHEMIPGQVVHYVAYGTPGGEYPAGAHRAAIITEIYDEDRMPFGPGSKVVDPNIVGLCVLNPTGQFFNRYVEFDPTGQKPGTWHWMEISDRTHWVR